MCASSTYQQGGGVELALKILTYNHNSLGTRRLPLDAGERFRMNGIRFNHQNNNDNAYKRSR